MKKNYFDPKAEIIELSVMDIVTASEDIVDGGEGGVIEGDNEGVDGELGL